MLCQFPQYPDLPQFRLDITYFMAFCHIELAILLFPQLICQPHSSTSSEPLWLNYPQKHNTPPQSGEEGLYIYSQFVNAALHPFVCTILQRVLALSTFPALDGSSAPELLK